jgi:peptidoglycan/LPS O-acetylase OafA/YrhL
MEMMNQEQHRTWTVVLVSVFVLSAIWAAWNRNALSVLQSLGLALALALFYFAPKSGYPRLLRWAAVTCVIVSFVALLFRDVPVLLESNA